MEHWELAYIAGIIDGEGCFNVRKDSRCNSYSVRIQLTNTDYRMIEFVQIRFGGSCRSRGKENKLWRIRYDYHITNKQCEALVTAIYPFLVCKKEQAKLVLEFIEQSKSSKTRLFGNYFLLQMKALNAYRPMPATTECVSSFTKEMRQSELEQMRNLKRVARSSTPLG